jgi:hypothetical protein
MHTAKEGLMTRYVEKLRVPVRLSQPSLPPREGCLLLFPDTAHGRPECVLELLNSPRHVIPFILAGDESVLLLTRSNIDWVAVGSGVADYLVVPPDRAVTNEQRVELRFVDESRVEAVIGWGVNDESSRLSDFLNARESFFAANASFGTLIVNKLRVRESRVIHGAGRRDAAHDPARPM